MVFLLRNGFYYSEFRQQLFSGLARTLLTSLRSFRSDSYRFLLWFTFFFFFRNGRPLGELAVVQMNDVTFFLFDGRETSPSIELQIDNRTHSTRNVNGATVCHSPVLAFSQYLCGVAGQVSVCLWTRTPHDSSKRVLVSAFGGGRMCIP